MKWIGAILIILSCGGFGFYQAGIYRAEEKNLRDLLRCLDLMQCELQYRLTPLPQLCILVSSQLGGAVGHVFDLLRRELENQVAPEVSSCMRSALLRCKNLTSQTRQLIQELGASLGQYDTYGQLSCFDAIRMQARTQLEELSRNRDSRIRSYQTLGLCAGAALAILFV
jgi:stage III sporulation protein AB